MHYKNVEFWTLTLKNEEKDYLYKWNSLGIITNMPINTASANNLFYSSVIERWHTEKHVLAQCQGSLSKKYVFLKKWFQCLIIDGWQIFKLCLQEPKKFWAALCGGFTERYDGRSGQEKATG